MTQFDNTNRGTIGKNMRKREGSQDADLAGSINVNGVDYWLNGWMKKSTKDGSTFYSLSVKPKEERAAEIIRTAEPRGSRDLDDEIPF